MIPKGVIQATKSRWNATLIVKKLLKGFAVFD
jgi:hypothetical protein